MDKLLNGIHADPYGRRHKINLWQEEDFEASDGLMPCCYDTQWNVRGEHLDMLLNQRSGDMLTASGAGGWNEVQYAALQIMVAYATGYKPGIFTHVIANEHIYDRHMEAAKELIRRFEIEDVTEDNLVPVMKFEPKINDFYLFSVNDFTLENYVPKKPQIKLELGI